MSLDSDGEGDGELREWLQQTSGERHPAAPVRLGPGTWRIAIGERVMVAKRMAWTHPPVGFRRMIAAVQTASVGCPPLVSCIELHDCWYALFAFVNGTRPVPGTPGWKAAWDGAFRLLRRMRDISDATTPWNIEHDWLARVSSLSSLDSGAAELLDRLRAHRPIGTSCLAHGDFAPQNLLDTPAGLILLDWEEAGTASPGFDGGWLLALNRVGGGPHTSRDALLASLTAVRLPFSNLLWFEGLGLLRLQWRIVSWLPTRPALLPVLQRIRAVSEDFLGEYRAAPEEVSNGGDPFPAAC